MPYPVWPSSVPAQPEVEFYEMPEPWQPALLTEFEDDSVEELDRSTSRWMKASWGRHLTLAEAATLDEFLFVTCLRGKQLFQMPFWTPSNPEMPLRTVKLIGATYQSRSRRAWQQVTFQLRARL